MIKIKGIIYLNSINHSVIVMGTCSLCGMGWTFVYYLIEIQTPKCLIWTSLTILCLHLQGRRLPLKFMAGSFCDALPTISRLCGVTWQIHSDFITQFKEAANESERNCINQCPARESDVAAWSASLCLHTNRITISKINFSVWRGSGGGRSERHCI